MDRNEKAFSLLCEEFTRAQALIREIHFDHLMRLKNDLDHHIANNEQRTNDAPINVEYIQKSDAHT